MVMIRRMIGFVVCAVLLSGSVETVGTNGGPIELQIDNTWQLSGTSSRMALPVTDDKLSGPGRVCLRIVGLNSGRATVHDLIRGANWPAWSPRGDQVAYSKELNRIITLNIREAQICVYSLQEHSSVQLRDGFVDRDPDWRRNGEDIAFARLDVRPRNGIPTTRGRVMVVSTSGIKLGKPRPVGREHTGVDCPRWCPSGNNIAYIGNKFNPYKSVPRSTDLYLADVHDGKEKQLTNTGDIARYSLDWSPDGRHIAFATGVTKFKTLEVMDRTTHKRRIVLRAHGLGNCRIARVSSIRWSPKGTSIVFDVWKHDPAGPVDIMRLTWPQLRSTWLTRDGKSYAPRWSADGRTIFFIRNRKEVWQIRPDGTQAKRVYRLSASGLGR